VGGKVVNGPYLMFCHVRVGKVNWRGGMLMRRCCGCEQSTRSDAQAFICAERFDECAHGPIGRHLGRDAARCRRSFSEMPYEIMDILVRQKERTQIVERVADFSSVGAHREVE